MAKVMLLQPRQLPISQRSYRIVDPGKPSLSVAKLLIKYLV